jgi:hypothetical protein
VVDDGDRWGWLGLRVMVVGVEVVGDRSYARRPVLDVIGQW